MTNLVIASAPIANDKGAIVQTVPLTLDAAWVVQAITERGPLTVATIVELSGRSETTARKLLKSMVQDGTLWKDVDAKPATFEVIVTTTVDVDEDEIPVVDTAAVIEALEGVKNADDENDSKIDEIMDAITTPAKPKKSKKIAHTDVPDDRNEFVQYKCCTMWVTSAYAELVDPPMFENALEAYGWANKARDRAEGDHTPEEIAGLYFDVVTTYLEQLVDEGTITHSVWYGRTFRLRRTLVGHGKGTAAARPATKTTDK